MNINGFKCILAAVGLVLFPGALYAQKDASDDPVSAAGDQAVNDKWKPSLTSDGVLDRVKRVGNPIPWQYIRPADVLYKKRVWRYIDVFEKQNMAFRYRGDENTGGGMFIEILLDGLKRGKISGYSNFDDRFTEKMTKEQVLEQTKPKADTIEQQDAEGNIVKSTYYNEFDPNAILGYRIKEDWIFDRNMGKMVVRIVGIAPVIDLKGEGGVSKGASAMFWLYYPELRNLLASYEVYNTDNEMARITWDEYFESRRFASKIYKVSNPLDLKYEEIFGADPRAKMEALYQSQQDADELFKKEHDMWVY
jgi:gliding motility associated protien GldN